MATLSGGLDDFNAGGGAVVGEEGGAEALPGAVLEGVSAQVALVLGLGVETQGEEVGPFQSDGDVEVVDGADGAEAVGDLGDAVAEDGLDTAGGGEGGDGGEGLADGGRAGGIGLIVIEEGDGGDEEDDDGGRKGEDGKGEEEEARVDAAATAFAAAALRASADGPATERALRLGRGGAGDGALVSAAGGNTAAALAALVEGALSHWGRLIGLAGVGSLRPPAPHLADPDIQRPPVCRVAAVEAR